MVAMITVRQKIENCLKLKQGDVDESSFKFIQSIADKIELTEKQMDWLNSLHDRHFPSGSETGRFKSSGPNTKLDLDSHDEVEQ